MCRNHHHHHSSCCRHNKGYNYSQSCRHYSNDNENEPYRRNSVDIDINANIDQDADANANGGNGGNGNDSNGGDGGDGGNIGITQEATIEVENVVIITNDSNHMPHSVNLKTNGKKLEINSDSNGNILVNGQRMNEQELEDGTKVFVFRNNESKKRNSKA